MFKLDIFVLTISLAISALTADFNCNDTNTCSGTNTCPDGQNCDIQCIGTSSCENAIFYCPQNYDCNINGNGERAMWNAQIYGGDNGDLVFICDEIYCFRSGRLWCPANANCDVTAPSGHFSFGHSYIYAQNSLLLNMYSTANWGFGYADIYCPYSLESGSQNNCNVKVENAQNMLINTFFFAVESFTDINIECLNGDGCDGGKMYCGSNYASTCIIQQISGSNDEYECTDATSECHPPTPAPTASPTSNPTQLTSNPTPTSKPTDFTQSPTDFTQSPTNPTPKPTTKPTSNPTSNPTPKPTSKPTDFTQSPTDFTQSPTKPTTKPTTNPTPKPTTKPTSNPTRKPTTKAPTLLAVIPTKTPTKRPTLLAVIPTKTPTPKPTAVYNLNEGYTIKIRSYTGAYLTDFGGSVATFPNFVGSGALWVVYDSSSNSHHMQFKNVASGHFLKSNGANCITGSISGSGDAASWDLAWVDGQSFITMKNEKHNECCKSSTSIFTPIDTSIVSGGCGTNSAKYKINIQSTAAKSIAKNINDITSDTASEPISISISILLIFAICIIINICFCTYKIATICNSKHKQYEKVLSTEIDESSVHSVDEQSQFLEYN